MNRIYNKLGPDFDVGFPTTRRSRDGPERRPRDGPERRPRDGPDRRPRDGPDRSPRDEIILWKGSLVIRYFYRHTDQPQDVRIHGRPSSKWRTFWWSKIGLTDRYGRSMSF